VTERNHFLGEEHIILANNKLRETPNLVQSAVLLQFHVFCYVPDNRKSVCDKLANQSVTLRVLFVGSHVSGIKVQNLALL
jgi:hypothetical protein